MIGFEEIGLSDRQAAEAAILKWKSLAYDLEMLLGGKLPDPELLARSPLIERWTVVPKALAALQGIVVRHPLKADTLAAMKTSPVVVSGEKFGWVRTESRFYRLGGQDDGTLFPW